MMASMLVASLLCLSLSGSEALVAPGLSKQRASLSRLPAPYNIKGSHRMATVPMEVPTQKVQSGISTQLKDLLTFFQVTVVKGFFGKIGAKLNRTMSQATNKMEDGWTKRGSGSAWQRTVEVWGFAFKFGFSLIKSRKLEKTDPEKFMIEQAKNAVMLRDKLLELGPTFIKLGQLLSTRIDVLPKAYIDALVQLQDQVPGFSGERAIEIIENELGKPIKELYDDFDKKSLAAASLGQVHLATMNGKKVAVKIQREGLKELFDKDLKNIKLLAVLLDKFDPKTDGAARDWGSIYDESARLLYQEIDYKLESENCKRFKKNFKDVPWVRVPDVYTNMTTEKVITMEYVPGIKVNDIKKIEAAGINKELLAKRSAEAYLMQICRHGFFHCDPHPGNVACNAEMDGTLIFYDFGMMDELKVDVRAGLVDLIFSIYENDAREACNALEKIGCLKSGVDRVGIEKIARVFLNEFSTGLKPGQKWTNQLSKEEQKAIRKKRRAQLGNDLFSVGSDVPFAFPPTFTFVFRAFTSLDGIGKGLDGQYDITRIAQPFLRELVDLRDGSALLSFANTWGKKLGLRPVDIAQAVGSPRSVANLEDIITRMEQGDLKIRVRDLKTENSFVRMGIVQENMGFAIAASAALNVGLVLNAATPAGVMTAGAKAALASAGIFGSQLLAGVVKLKALDKKLSTFEG